MMCSFLLDRQLRYPSTRVPGIRDWQGLVCSSCSSPSSVCHILNISLEQYKLVGTLPNDLNSLSYLVHFDVNHNYLSGTIPSSIGLLSSLRILYLGYNSFTGPTPSSLGLLPLLLELYLNDNDVSGSIPSSLGMLSSMQKLYLSGNDLTSSIPSSLGNLRAIHTFYLILNHLTGTIPSSLGNLTSAQIFYLALNKLTGTIPSSLGLLSSLQQMFLDVNRLTGSIPSSFSLLTKAFILYVNDNRLSMAFPTCLCSLTFLEAFYISANLLTGTLPSCIATMSSLRTLDIQGNLLSGPLPSALGLMQSAQILYLAINKFTGTIPSSFSQLHVIRELYLNNNRLTGSIPRSFSAMQSLQQLYLNFNRLSGSIPSSLGLLSSLRVLNLQEDHLTGSIPSSLGLLSFIQIIYLSGNQLSGTLPSSLGLLSTLQYLSVSLNKLTGTIPSSVMMANSLQSFVVNGNRLSGTLPTSLGQLTVLVYLLADHNELTGTIPTGVVNLGSLLTVDLGFNQLTGPFPCELFGGSNIESVVLSNNCFTGPLPDCVCNADSLQTLVVAGLTSASSCSYKMFYNPLIRINDHSVTGEVPRCLFSMNRLRAVYADGNGIYGTLPDIQLSRSLINISLSNNNFKGELPNEWKIRAFVLLDLSFNELSGTLDGMVKEALPGNHSNISVPVLRLDVNRLSGNIPVNISANGFANLNILDGNMFACSQTYPLPDDDMNVHRYSCGSDELNTSIYLWIASVLEAVVVCSCVYYCVWEGFRAVDGFWSSVTGIYSLCTKLLFGENVNGTSSVAVSLIHKVLSEYRWNVFVLTMIVCLVHLPVYCLLKVWYATHSYEYGWYPSLVYMEGVCPVVLTVICFLLLWAAMLYLFRRSYKAEVLSNIALRSISVAEYMERSVFSWAACGLFCLNCVIVSLVNGMYVYVILTQRLPVQRLVYVLLVLFKLGWNNLTFKIFAKFDAIWKLFSLVCNVMVIPILVTLCIDTSCFYHLIVPAEPVVSHYSVTSCYFPTTYNNSAVETCRQEIVQDSFYTPSFYYGYQCGSALLVNYVSVFVAMFTISGVVIPVAQLFLMVLLERSVVDKEKWLMNWLMSLVPKSVRPYSAIEVHYGVEKLCLNLTMAVLVLLVFGTGYPLLALVIFLSIALKSLVIQVSIVRHWEIVKDAGTKVCVVWEANLMKECENIKVVLYAYMPLFLLLGGMFLFPLLLDLERGFISPLLMMSLLLVLQLFFMHRLRQSKALLRTVSTTKNDLELVAVISAIHDN